MAESRPLQGRKLGDKRVVVDRPHARYFRYLGPGVLEAKLEAQAPRTAAQRRMATLRAILFGRPLSSAADLTERLPIWKALPVFSSDVMSSVAYATGAMMLILVGAGQIQFQYVLGLSVVVVACWSSSRSATARRSGPIPTAAAATSSPTRISACSRGWSLPAHS